VSKANIDVRRRRLTCLGFLFLTLPIGLAWRLAPLGLPAFAFKYGGSALWAVAVYWVVALCLARRPVVLLAVIAGCTALTVELAKLIYWPPLDRFRETLAGKLLLGRYFTLGAVVAYWLAIACVALLDARFRPGLARAGYAAHQDGQPA
jgi:hypothetical protein